MKRFVGTSFRALLAASLTWATALACYHLQTNRSIASMALVLEVLAVAAWGDWMLAVLTSASASLAFSYYFVNALGFRITSYEGAITFSMMVITALTGSQLAIRAHRRAAEAIRRREEMERLQQLGNALLAANTVAEAAENVVGKVVELFGVSGAVLRIEGEKLPFQSGVLTPGRSSRLEFSPRAGVGPATSVLELYGKQPSAEVRSALANLIDLVLDRARSAEERARIEATQRGEELRNTVLNALAHNFRTPLTSIKAAASMLRGSQEISTAHGRELVTVIDEEADRLDQLIRESLDLARIEAHQANPRLEPCSLSEIAAIVMARVSRYMARREWIADIPYNLPLIQGDSFLLEQMLMQVVDNAWKYSRPGARIRISAVERDRDVVLTVWNQGAQIPDDERERIFGKFYRGAVNRSQVEGTGLGLAIAKAIVETHGGTIWLDAAPDGPAFRFSLPVDRTGTTRDRESYCITDRR
ncbi:MAG: ATP-binding protein [Bryobacteraceae bacterium]|jgi:two-component system sensor histidine kinase KdpD